MTNRKSTKKALLMSALSLLLCCSMLIGTTFAWFTDEVNSGINKIVAGNLDVEVYNSLVVGENKVGSETKLFDHITYWEPGVVAYENLTVANLGTLALKYQLSVNFDNATTNANGDTLAKVLKVGFVKGGINTDVREDALDLVTTWLPLESFVQAGDLMKGENDVYGIVIWWEPSDIDNEFNMNNENLGKVMSIDLGIKLVATQLNAENDSYGPDYDEDAWADGWKVYNAQDLQAALNNGETNIVVMDDIELTEAIVIPAAPTTYSLRSATPSIVINLNGSSITAGEGGYVIMNESGATLVIADETGKSVINGIIYTGAKSATVINGGTYNAVEGGKYVFLNSSGSLTINKATINGGSSYPLYSYDEGHKLVVNDAIVSGPFGCINTYGAGIVEVNGGSFTVTGAKGKTHHCVYVGTNAELIINGGTFAHNGAGISDSGATITVYAGANGGATINGGTFTGSGTYIKAFDKYDSKCYFVINGGTFSNNPSKYVAEGYTVVDNGDGTWTALKGDVVAGDNAGLNDALANGEDNIALGAGDFNMPSTSGDVSISGTLDTVITINKPTANNVTLNGVTVVGSGNYTGIQHSDVVVYENCVIKGVQFLYANKVIFKNCTIDLTEKADYIWTYAAKNVEFIDCTFNTAGKALLIYSEDANLVTNVTVKGCTFNATASALASGHVAAAIEIDSSLSKNGHYTLTTENNTVDSDFSGEWRVKKSGTNNTTVNGVIYNKVEDGLYKGTDATYYVYNANGLATLNTMMANKTAGRDTVVNLLADIDMTGKTWTPVDSHADSAFEIAEINGNGHTIYNLTVNGQAMFTRFAGSGDVVIKNLTFDGATVNSGALNTAILTVQSYQNVLLDNVDVKNSSISGNYKVAALIATVYNESATTVTATLKNCDVSNTTVHGNLDFMVAGLVAFVYESDNDQIVFENCTVADVTLSSGSKGYDAVAAVYCNDGSAEGSFDNVAGVTVTNVTKK